MAINFEAANMAGYNNPKIEVFTLTLNDNMEIMDSPTQSVLSDCINRGSVPFLNISENHNTLYILPIAFIKQQTDGLEVGFSTVTRAGTTPSAAPFVLEVIFPTSGYPRLFTTGISAGKP